MTSSSTEAPEPAKLTGDQCERIARSLREFGWPDVTSQMVADTEQAMDRGDAVMPHSVVGMFARSQIEEAREAMS